MFHHIQISSTEKVLYQKLTYTNFDDLVELLTTRGIDLQQLKTISHFKRKVEWMSARQMVIHEMPNEDIVYDSNNKPFFKYSKAHLSISHSTDMIAVGINRDKEIGIDLQHVTDKIIRIKDKFLDKEESKSCSNNAIELTCYWTVKEALFKLYGIKDAYLKENMKVRELSFDGTVGNAIGQLNINQLNTQYNFELRKIEDYILAFSVNS